jgi:hypothetical protein
LAIPVIWILITPSCDSSPVSPVVPLVAPDTPQEVWDLLENPYSGIEKVEADFSATEVDGLTTSIGVIESTRWPRKIVGPTGAHECASLGSVRLAHLGDFSQQMELSIDCTVPLDAAIRIPGSVCQSTLSFEALRLAPATEVVAALSCRSSL